MKALIICPDHRPGAELVRQVRPLALLPVLGRTLIDIWLERLADLGVKEVLVLAADRPKEVRDTLAQTDHRGLVIQVLPVQSEPSIEMARARFIAGREEAWHGEVVTLDTLPGQPEARLWQGGAVFHQALLARLESGTMGASLTMRETAPGVHVSTRARVAGSANIEGPAWIGPGVIVADHAQILAGTIIEDAAYIDRQARVEGSWIGPETYVGAMTEITESIAWGNGLESMRYGSQIRVADTFLLSDLRPKWAFQRKGGHLARLFALLLLLGTVPQALFCMLKSIAGRRPVFRTRRVVLPELVNGQVVPVPATLGLLNGAGELFSRWPWLWQVICGRIRLVGNRPMSPGHAASLREECEQLWHDAPAGLFSLADAMKDGLDDPDAEAAHSACYAVGRSSRLDLRILARCLPDFLLPRVITDRWGAPQTPTATNPACQ